MEHAQATAAGLEQYTPCSLTAASSCHSSTGGTTTCSTLHHQTGACSLATLMCSSLKQLLKGTCRHQALVGAYCSSCQSHHHDLGATNKQGISISWVYHGVVGNSPFSASGMAYPGCSASILPSSHEGNAFRSSSMTWLRAWLHAMLHRWLALDMLRLSCDLYGIAESEEELCQANLVDQGRHPPLIPSRMK